MCVQGQNWTLKVVNYLKGKEPAGPAALQPRNGCRWSESMQVAWVWEKEWDL